MWERAGGFSATPHTTLGLVEQVSLACATTKSVRRWPYGGLTFQKVLFNCHFASFPLAPNGACFTAIPRAVTVSVNLVPTLWFSAIAAARSACKGMLRIEGDAYESTPLRWVCEWASRLSGCTQVAHLGRHVFLLVIGRKPCRSPIRRSHPGYRLECRRGKSVL